MTFLPMLSSSNENSERELNTILWPLCFNFSGSECLLSFTASNERSFGAKLLFNSRDYLPNS